MDDISYRKLRNIVTIAPKSQVSWTELSRGRSVALPSDQMQKVETNLDKIRSLVMDFLNVRNVHMKLYLGQISTFIES